MSSVQELGIRLAITAVEWICDHLKDKKDEEKGGNNNDSAGKSKKE